MQALIEMVQRNCDICDARHGSDFGMCTYLLKMRELYRWERGLPLGAPLGKDDVGDWLTMREAHLENLQGADFAELPIGGQSVDPFDAEAQVEGIAEDENEDKAGKAGEDDRGKAAAGFAGEAEAGEHDGAGGADGDLVHRLHQNTGDELRKGASSAIGK